MKKNKEYLQDYLFYYNPYAGLWSRIHRSDYNNFMNGLPTIHEVYTHKSIMKIVNIVNGDKK